MSLIPEIPAAPFVPLYPALGSLNFNQEAYAYGTAMPGVTTRLREIAAACRECAFAAREDAMSAESSRMLSAQQADQAMSYRNQAANSATAAAGSASTASTHASNAVGAYTQMQALYLGAKTSNPVKDNQGNALQLGAWYTYVGTDPALKGVWLWWDGTGWNPGIGPVIGTLMPKSGGKFTGYVSGPAGAKGEEFPQAQEVLPRKVVNLATATADLNLLPHEVMFADGADLSNRPASGDTWHYFFQIPHSSPGYKLQISAGLTANTPLFFRRQVNGNWNTPGGWRRLLDAMDCTPDVKAEAIASSVTDWEINAGAGAIQQIYISGPIKFWMAPHRRPSETVILKVQFLGAPHAIAFDAAVIQPKTPIPPYAANDVLTMLFMHRVGTSRYDLYYCGVNLP
ncbi:hypothetical protein [Delftia tsuruhatensis]|uniref:hypothetical protein n=1 Tax=Delftia tsuruhatensis TaxID=180282 RepID=UPI00370C7FF1